MRSIPRIISVDDHVFEPPDLWQSRLPAQFKDKGPRVRRQRLVRKARGRGGAFDEWTESEEGAWCDVWYYDDLVYPLMQAFAAVGMDTRTLDTVTFDEIRPGAWKQHDRLLDMDINGVDFSICYPNTLPRFCGQAFYEAPDRELALLCVRAYNDWVLEEWSGGEGTGRITGACIVPLWDPEEAGREIRRCAEKGSVTITFPENPHPLGLPSFHDKTRPWDPVFQACQETGTVLSMHIGSSSRMPTTSPDAPFAVSLALTSQNAMGSLMDLIFSKTLERYPKLKVAYAEAQVGWLPFLLERADKFASRTYTGLSQLPSEYVAGRVWGCIFDDETGLQNREAVGMDQICFEVDYPHADSTFPGSTDTLRTLADAAQLTDEELVKLARTNAIEAYGLERLGIFK